MNNCLRLGCEKFQILGSDLFFMLNLKYVEDYVCVVNFMGMMGQVCFDKFGDFLEFFYDIVYFKINEILDSYDLVKLVIGLWEKNCKKKFELNIGSIRWNIISN